jgi:signal transduction histidine kinase
MRKTFLKFACIFFLLFSTQFLYAQIDFSDQLTLNKSLQNMSVSEIIDIYNSGKYSEEQSIACANFALERTIKEKDSKSQFIVTRHLGAIRENSNQLGSALQFYHQAEVLATNVQDDKALISIYFDLAITHRKNSDYKLCKEYYDKIIALCPKLQNNEYLEFAYHGLGNLYQITGDYEKATDYFLKSTEVAEQSNNTSGVAMSLQHVAETMLLAKNPDKALVNIEKAYQLSLKCDDPELIGLILKDYGQILAEQGKFNQALEKFNAALQYLDGANTKPFYAKVLMCIADAHASKGEHRIAATFLFRCLNDYTSLILNEDLGELYLKIGKYYVSSNEKTKAKINFEKGLEVCKKYDLKNTLIKTALELSKIEEKNGNLAVAFDLFKMAKSMEDSLFTQEKIAKTAELQFKFDADKSDREIQDLKLRQNNILIIGLVLFTAAILLSSFIWAKSKNRATKELRIRKDETEHQNRRLEESNMALKEFAYASAHDLKEPLRNIGSFISLLKRRYGHTFNEEALEYMNFVNMGVAKMDKLLEDLLHYSTLVMNSDGNEHLETAKLNDVLDEIKVSLHSTIDQKSADIQYRKLPDLPMSKLHQTQLFQNLISNALKFVENQAPIIKINANENESDTIISVQDNGIGIKQEYSDKVFKLFHRLNKNANYEGTGVGLSICKNIVEKYNGKIWFESEENKGTVFYIKLPKKAA